MHRLTPLLITLPLTLTTALTHAHQARSPTCTTAKPAPSNTYISTPITLPNSSPARTFTLYLPSTYDGTTALPLILSYHGHGKSSANQAQITDFYNNTLNPTYIVAFPQGLPGTTSNGEAAWQGASYAAPGVDDVAFTSALLDHLESEYCVDPSRIYASGKSNGGGFVDTLACSSAGGRFAAFSACSGAFYTDVSFDGADGSPTCDATAQPSASTTRTRFPFLETHGSADTTISYDGNDPAVKKNGATPGIPAWLSWWARRNGCAATDQGTSALSAGGVLNHTVWSCNGQEDVVQGWWVKGMGHDWPGPPGGEGGPVPLRGSEVVLDFFGQWTL